MRFGLVLSLLVVCCAVSGAEEVRKWKAGEFSEEGTFVSLAGEVVVLRLTNGEMVEVDLSSLSPEDQKYIHMADAGKKNSPFRRKLAESMIENSVGIKLVQIPAGTFKMGQANGDADETVHQVTLTHPFYIGIYEVTNAQWKRVMGSMPSEWQDDNMPVQNVSWSEATHFCQKLSALTDERRAGNVYRLPTEAEWEYACRGGTTTTFAFGDDASRLGEYAWFLDNSGKKTQPVGLRKPNPWGLYDMHGNVWEWCSDLRGGKGGYGRGDVNDPQGDAAGDYRAYRGGAWHNHHSLCRSATRGGNKPSYHGANTGFRLALSPAGAQPLDLGR